MAEMIRFQWVLDIYSIYKIRLYKFLGVVFPLHYQFDGKKPARFPLYPSKPRLITNNSLSH